MSAIEKVSQLSHRIFNTSKNELNTSRTSNPFAASNFQKNILTEDVFESSKSKEGNKIGFTGNISASSKRIYSTFVGSINDFGSRISEGIESIKAFGIRMKEGIVNSCVNTWNKINEIGQTDVGEILSRDISSFFGKSKEKEIAKMATLDPHMEVKPMLADALKALEADIAQVA